MRKLFPSIILVLMWSNIGFAETISIICKNKEFTEIVEFLEIKKEFNKWTILYKHENETFKYIDGELDDHEDKNLHKIIVNQSEIIWTSESSKIKIITLIDRINGTKTTEFKDYTGELELSSMNSNCSKNEIKF